VLAAALLVSVGAPAADVAAGRGKAEACVACHGPGGNATLPGVPSLAAQPALHTFLQLVQFREKRRRDAQMSPFAEKLSDRDMQDLGAYFAAQKPAAPKFQAAASRAAAGRSVLELHHCGSCHMPDLSGQQQIPRLAGQDFQYLVKQMRGLKDGSRRDIDGTMASAAQALSDQDIENLAHYLASKN
jgi:cytochrome c553